MQKSSKLSQLGFTLIELIVVLTVIGLLIAIIIGFSNYSNSYSHDENNKKFALEARSVIEKYYGYFNKYPSLCGAVSIGGKADLQSLSSVLQTVGKTSYLSSESKDLLDRMKFANPSGIDDIFKYCGEPSDLGSDSTAYVIMVKANTAQKCPAIAGNSYFLTGAGTFNHTDGKVHQYYDIPGIAVPTSYSSINSSCFG